MNLLALPPALLAFIAALPITHAQYPSSPTNQTVLKSPIDPNVSIAYTQPTVGTCTTAFPTQKQYTGYISMPPYTLAPIQQDYPINTFFWFIEARQAPEAAPLTIWLNGGPGSSSMFGLFNEVGPCEVVQMADGTYGTQMRPFGWDRASNMLFIDQPNLVGFSYDTATNASLNLFTNQLFEPPTSPSSQLPGFMYFNGTFGTANENAKIPYANTANTTEIAARATWHFLQTWLSTFTQYNPTVRPNATVTSSGVPAGVNLFTESYGGKYGPVFASYFEEQNQAIATGQLAPISALPIRLQSVGIMNGLVDDLIQDFYYPIFAVNNTYGVDVVDQTTQLNAINNYTQNCLPAIQACRAANADLYGDNYQANELCESAQYTCNGLVDLVSIGGYNPYDIRQKLPSPDPSAAYQEYLNQQSVLSSIGARVSYVESGPYVQEGFISTGDSIRGGMVDDLAYLLKLGIRVALIYGDADWVCNWLGGQAVAFAIANSLSNYTTTNSTSSTASSGTPSNYANGFAAAGFADIVVNDTTVGGVVRQYGNLSFSRVYNSGHFIPYFQPETAFQIFARVIFGNDISLGTDIDLATFASNGTANATATNSVPPSPAPTCWVRNWNASCSDDDTHAMLQGDGVVSYGMYFQASSEVTLPTTSVNAGIPGSPMKTSTTTPDAALPADMSLTTALTGFYTATGTPTSTSGSVPRLRVSSRDEGSWPAVVVVVLGLMAGVAVVS